MKAPHNVPPRGWLPYPALSALLALMWLALQQSLAVPQLITAALLGLAVPRLVAGFLGPANQPWHPALILRFMGIVLWDIVVSNLTVARIVLNPWSAPQPAWVEVPLDIEHPLAIMLFASIITTTPGTVSAVVDEPGRRILVHALDCADPQGAALQMKQRYEAPLRRIFEGDAP
ncbi:MAG TPA: Na+/H+ antiporter subunit E [Rubrivivax sp.]